ncbi:SLAM family member 5 [Camelus dromedarius]|uniref:SLAM family member 5 n=1 Tax=Camelus dromedarius TaxID=9838 RepID=A0A5N4CN41_CAMDR|nr:SLAM family member 5 [Camelus dromedarius]
MSVCSTGAKSPGAHVPLQKIRGASVLFHVTKEPGAELEEVSWGFGPESNYRVLLKVRPGTDAPTWISLQDKYQQRVHVPNMMSLRIENLTSEDSGQYRARISFVGGIERTQVFPLIIYEPVPPPQILPGSPSIAAGWCNVTLECRASEDTEDLNVTWESRGLEHRVTPGPAPNPWTLAVSLPLSQPSPSLSCVVSNQVDQKTATLGLGEVCAHDSHGQASANLLPGILGATVAVLLILGGGLYLWKTQKKKEKMETRKGNFGGRYRFSNPRLKLHFVYDSGTELQEDHRDHDGGIEYAELSQPESPEGTYKKTSLTVHVFIPTASAVWLVYVLLRNQV